MHLRNSSGQVIASSGLDSLTDHATKVAALGSGTGAKRDRFPGMASRKNQSDDGADQGLDDRVAWVVIGLIVASAALVLWVPLLMQVAG